LQTEADEFDVKTTALQVETAEVAEEIETATVSGRLMQQSKESLNAELEGLKDECLAVMIMTQSYVPSDAIDAIEAPLAESMDAFRFDRLSLLEDIEAEYNIAVSVRGASDARLAGVLRSSSTLLDASLLDQQSAGRLLDEIRQLEETRSMLEQSLYDCQSSLADCENNISIRSRSIDDELRSLAEEEAQLTLDCELLENEEAAMRHELEELRGAGVVAAKPLTAVEAERQAEVVVQVAETKSIGAAALANVKTALHKTSVRNLKPAVSVPSRSAPHASKTKAKTEAPPTKDEKASSSTEDDLAIEALSSQIRSRLATALDV
jgi:hypothetical protein